MSATAVDADLHVPFGFYSDGAPATVPVLDHGWLGHGVVLGSAGAGKTVLMDTLAAAARNQGTLMDRIHPSNVVRQLERLREEVPIRRQELHSGRTVLPPLLLLVDNAADVFATRFGAGRTCGHEIGVSLREARALNVALVAAVPDPTLASFGGSALLRDMLITGTTLLMRHRAQDLRHLPCYDGQPVAELPCGQGYTLTGACPHEVWTVPGPH